jgi:SAM-dependent methyltransferase
MKPPEAGGSVLERADYLAVSYDPARVPFGPYPGRLCRWLHENVFRTPGSLLDIGCGRGEFMSGFAALGYRASGVDVSPAAPGFAPGFDVRVANLERDPLPFEAGSFDYVFSKSVVEHVRDPDAFLAQCAAALRPGGIAVIMTPSWVHNHWGPFYVDHTHVTPFTAPSLQQAMTLAGLEGAAVSHFLQLPLVWRLPVLKPLCALVAALPIPFRPFHPGAPWPDGLNKFIRFSNEVMLLGTARKSAPGAVR